MKIWSFVRAQVGALVGVVVVALTTQRGISPVYDARHRADPNAESPGDLDSVQPLASQLGDHWESNPPGSE